jgi:hypothetical protein
MTPMNAHGKPLAARASSLTYRRLNRSGLADLPMKTPNLHPRLSTASLAFAAASLAAQTLPPAPPADDV